MLLNKTIFTALFISLISVSAAFSQGVLRGTVIDQIEDEPLIGATVLIEGSSLGTSTDENGRYQLRRVPSGETIHVRFSYIGYETQTFEIILEEGEIRELDVEMRAASLEGDEINISAQAMGQVAAINQQRSSNTIVNVVSAEKIRELPDANAAESIGRLSGVSLLRSGGEANKVILRGLSDKYLSVTVDGVRLPTTDALARGIDLSTISQSSLSGIELYKSLTPDKDADAIAGSINLVTRKAPAERELGLRLTGGYNSIVNSANQYDFSGRYGERFFDGLIGLQLNGNYEQKIRSNERNTVSYSDRPSNPDDYFISSLNLVFTDEIRTRGGFGGILDFNTPDEGNIKLSSMYSTTTRNYLTHRRNYPVGGDVVYNYRDTEKEITMLSNSITGQNHLFGFDTNWGASYSHSESETPFDFELRFIEPAGMGNPPQIRDNPAQLIDFSYNNFNSASISDGYDYEQNNSHGELSAYFDLIREYVISNSVSGAIKGGIKYRSQNRTNETFRYYAPYYLGYWRPYTLADDGSIVEKDFSGSYFEDFYESYLQNPAFRQISFRSFLHDDPQSKILLDKFNMNPLISKDRIRQWYEINRYGINQNGTAFEFYNDPSAEANTYDITESVSAAYLMNTFNFGQRLVMIAGLRIEQENHDYENKYSPRQIGGFPVPQGVTRDTTSSYSETAVLPHLHLNIKATDFMNVRIAGYKALARPDYNMRLLSFFAWRDSETGGDRIFVVGNPILKTAKAWNFELSTSFHSNQLGLLTLSGFYKHIDDMYHMLNGIFTQDNVLLEELGLEYDSPHNAGYRLYVPYNSPDPSYVRGFELDHQINFSWLPGLLRNIVLSYNVSMVQSETTLRGAVTDTTYVNDPILGQVPRYNVRPVIYTQEMENQPELFGNISLGYDIGGFSGRVSMFHQSEYYKSFSSNRRSDPISIQYTRFDVALNYKFQKYLTLVSNLNNITNIKEGDIRHNRLAGYKIPTSSERYGFTFDVGIRLEL